MIGGGGASRAGGRVVVRSALLAAMLALAPAARAGPSQVRLGWRGATDTTIAVTWRSSERAGAVEYAAAGRAALVRNAESRPHGPSYLHSAELTDLGPATTYRYRVGTAGAWSRERTFTTGPRRGTASRFRFAAFGDSRTDVARRARVGAAIASRRPAFSIATGDLVDDGREQPQWDDWFATMEPLISASPLLVVAGNHEYGASLVFDQLALPSHAPRAGGYDDAAYYSLDYGDVHLVALSTEPTGPADGPQARWLAADLASVAADPRVRWIVAFLHRPPFSSGQNGSDHEVRASFVPWFERYGVDLVVCGHEHSYERTHPLREGRRAEAGGVVYVVSGGAGAPLRPVGRSAFTAASASASHFLEVEVAPESLSVSARDVDGNVFDAFTIRHDGAADGSRSGRTAPGPTTTGVRSNSSETRRAPR